MSAFTTAYSCNLCLQAGRLSELTWNSGLCFQPAFPRCRPKRRPECVPRLRIVTPGWKRVPPPARALVTIATLQIVCLLLLQQLAVKQPAPYPLHLACEAYLIRVVFDTWCLCRSSKPRRLAPSSNGGLCPAVNTSGSSVRRRASDGEASFSSSASEAEDEEHSSCRSFGLKRTWNELATRNQKKKHRREFRKP